MKPGVPQWENSDNEIVLFKSDISPLIVLCGLAILVLGPLPFAYFQAPMWLVCCFAPVLLLANAFVFERVGLRRPALRIAQGSIVRYPLFGFPQRLNKLSGVFIEAEYDKIPMVIPTRGFGAVPVLLPGVRLWLRNNEQQRELLFSKFGTVDRDAMSEFVRRANQHLNIRPAPPMVAP